MVHQCAKQNFVMDPFWLSPNRLQCAATNDRRKCATHYLEIHLLVAVGAGLLLAYNAPSTDAELVELVAAGEAVGVLQNALLFSRHQ